MPDGYELVIADRFYKDLRQIDAQNQKRILDALRKVRQEPYQGRKVIVAQTGQYRWRVGPYRIRYDIEETKSTSCGYGTAKKLTDARVVEYLSGPD